MFRYELKLAIRSKLIIFSLIIGILSGIPGIVSYYSDTKFMIAAGMPEAVSCYQAWLYALSLGSGAVYKILVPLLIIPNLDSFFVERKNGYSNFVAARSDHKTYFFAKLFSGVLVSGLILTVVMVVWFCVCAIAFPHNVPVDSFTYIASDSFRELFVEKPIVYILIIIVLNISFAIIFYSLGYGISYFCKNKYIVMVIPFLIYLSMTMLASLLNFEILSPISMVVPHEILGASWNTIILKFIIMGCVSSFVVLFSFARSYQEV